MHSILENKKGNHRDFMAFAMGTLEFGLFL